MAEHNASQQPPGPPYAPQMASPGGLPTVPVDVPICAVLLFLYACFAATNMTIFQLNRRRGHKFIISGALFGFCMARILTCTLRMAWATHPTSVNIAVTSQIFTNLGIIIVFVVNILLSQRVLRARRPALGWHPLLKKGLVLVYVLVAICVVMLITFTVISIYTLDQNLLLAARDIQRAVSTYLDVIVVIPVFFLVAAFLPGGLDKAEHFGHGNMNHKVLVLTGSIALCVLEEGFKSGVLWSPPRAKTDPAWYDSKAAFYCFEFVPEILILALLVSTRIDKRFHIPNGSSKVKSYAPRADAPSNLERMSSLDEEVKETESI